MNFCLDEKIFELKKISKLNRFYNIIELTEKDLIFNSTTQYINLLYQVIPYTYKKIGMGLDYIRLKFYKKFLKNIINTKL